MRTQHLITINAVIIAAMLVVGCSKSASPSPQTVTSPNTPDKTQSAVYVNHSKNNLKQIFLSFMLWAQKHNGNYPFNVSQAEGGTRELCDRDSEGFEKNPAPVFMVMSNALWTTKVLICPNDKTKSAAADFASLTTNNISYKLRTGANVSLDHPSEVLAIDPINGLVLHCDGSVQESAH
jgi:hypothetical protein